MGSTGGDYGDLCRSSERGVRGLLMIEQRSSKTPSEYMFSELPPIAEILESSGWSAETAKRAFASERFVNKLK
jgi:hypothetical protein